MHASYLSNKNMVSWCVLLDPESCLWFVVFFLLIVISAPLPPPQTAIFKGPWLSVCTNTKKLTGHFTWTEKDGQLVGITLTLSYKCECPAGLPLLYFHCQPPAFCWAEKEGSPSCRSWERGWFCGFLPVSTQIPYLSPQGIQYFEFLNLSGDTWSERLSFDWLHPLPLQIATFWLSLPC